jgi:hypothetical protein
MWILPINKSITSACAVDTKESGLDSEEFSQICERSLTWRGKDSLSRTWLQRWKRESWMQHLCTRTLKPSLTESSVDAWISSLEASRANPSVLLESVKALKILDTCSHTSQTESESANLELFSSKTSKELSQPRQQMGSQFSSMSSESWKAWVTEQRQEYSVRLKLAHLIRESGSTSWATPQTFDSNNIVRTPEKLAQTRAEKNAGCMNLREQVHYPEMDHSRKAAKNWPTATTRDWKDTNATVPPSRANPSKQTLGQRVAHVGLLDQANLSATGKSQGSQQWPTPRANKVHPVITEENREQLANRNKANLEEEIAGHCGKAQGKLNPDWVEQLMGLPVGWTDLGSWATE